MAANPACHLDSPASLETLCLNYICDNVAKISVKVLSVVEIHTIEKSSYCMVNIANRSREPHFCDSQEVPLVTVQSGDEGGEGAEPGSGKAKTLMRITVEPADEILLEDRFLKEVEVLRLSAGDFSVPANLSEILLRKLSNRRSLTDLTVSIFDGWSMKLNKVEIGDASKLTALGLRFLRVHNIQELKCVGLSRATVDQLVASLNDWTFENCKVLDVSRSAFLNCRKETFLHNIVRFKALSSVNVSRTIFNKCNLDLVTQALKQLEHLDISCTKVTDITSLVRCKHHLKSLNIYNLKLTAPEVVIDVVRQLKELRHLDMSIDGEGDTSEKLQANEILDQGNFWPHLVSLDISGRPNILASDVVKFLSSHNNIRFLGLMFSDVTRTLEMLEKRPLQREDLHVSGSGNEAQILEGLRRYPDREKYARKALSNLYACAQGMCSARIDLIKEVIAISKRHSSVISIQMAVTACLYYLSRHEISLSIHPKYLREIVDVVLDAMYTFPQHQQLQKNVLLTICNDHILQDIQFDRFRCAKLVLDSLCAWHDNSMNKMSVAVCSILAAKISTKETSRLGSNPRYMTKLLSIIRNKLSEKTNDVTLKFTLSALWNLTDESPETCKVFLNEGGMQLYMQLLEAFSADQSVKTKVLGLLNNIAEVRELRKCLIFDEFINQLRPLLSVRNIEVSYFAAGIAAYLSCNPQDDFWNKLELRNQLISELEFAVKSWKSPKSEMVSYRSFKPFFQLLEVGQAVPVHLWAIWAIYHVCSKNPKRYGPMLKEQGGAKVLLQLTNSTSTDSFIRKGSFLIVKLFASSDNGEPVEGLDDVLLHCDDNMEVIDNV